MKVELIELRSNYRKHESKLLVLFDQDLKIFNYKHENVNWKKEVSLMFNTLMKIFKNKEYSEEQSLSTFKSYKFELESET